jgi:hypothetical protein
VFKNAVQGLVKICFPQGVLEEIGIDVLERHMREEKAPEENIRKMVDVFRGEMVHRISSMLAVYLDTPEKVQVGIDAVKAASEALHGNVEPDERSTNTSNHGEPKDTFEEMIVDASNDPAAQAVTRPTKVMSKRGKEKEKAKEPDNAGDDSEMGVESSIQANKTLPASMKQQEGDRGKKVSASWRWDIDPESISNAAIAEVFKRPSDLFAFHALPIAWMELHDDAKQKDVRLHIQARLHEMAEAEWRKWMESLQKLHDGDMTMLIRPDPKAVLRGRRTAATPAPIDMQRRAANVISNNPNRGSFRGTAQDKAVREPVQRASRIKREPNTETNDAANDNKVIREENDMVATTRALRDLSTDETDIRPAATQATPSGHGTRVKDSHAAKENVSVNVPISM